MGEVSAEIGPEVSLGIRCSPLVSAAYGLYLALGIVLLLLPWLAWQWAKSLRLTAPALG